MVSVSGMAMKRSATIAVFLTLLGMVHLSPIYAASDLATAPAYILTPGKVVSYDVHISSVVEDARGGNRQLLYDITGRVVLRCRDVQNGIAAMLFEGSIIGFKSGEGARVDSQRVLQDVEGTLVSVPFNVDQWGALTFPDGEPDSALERTRWPKVYGKLLQCLGVSFVPMAGRDVPRGIAGSVLWTTELPLGKSAVACGAYPLGGEWLITMTAPLEHGEVKKVGQTEVEPDAKKAGRRPSVLEQTVGVFRDGHMTKAQYVFVMDDGKLLRTRTIVLHEVDK